MSDEEQNNKNNSITKEQAIDETNITAETDRNCSSNFDNERGGKADDDGDDESYSSEGHSKYIWLHAFYHSVVTIIGTGVLGFPYATSYLGWGGATVYITAISAYCYYTALLLIDLQQKGQGTYSEVTDAIMGNGFSNYTVKPVQFINFFLTASSMILVGGGALKEIDGLANGNDNRVLSDTYWMIVDASIIMVLSLLPDLNRAWQVSVVGSFAAFLIVGYCIGGSAAAIAEDYGAPVQYDQPDSVKDDPEYPFTIMSSFGSVLFGYGFHAVLPDIHASLHDHSTKDSKGDMKKAVTAAFSFSYPAYLIVALVGFAAFGYQVQSELLYSINNVLPKSAMYIIWVFVMIKTSTEAAVYNQGAFTLTRDIFGLTLDTDHVDHHPKNWKIDIIIRFVYVICATLVGLFLPYFNDLTSITAAISVTPTSLILPVFLWNVKHKRAGEAPKWRLLLHNLLMALSFLMASVALIGAVAEMVLKIKSDKNG